MSGYWILKTEPSTYGFDDLVRERTAVWDGVRNPVALRNPKAGDPSLVAVDLKAAARLPRPVTLAEIRQDKSFADLALVRQPRLSVVPCREAQYRRLLELAEGP